MLIKGSGFTVRKYEEEPDYSIEVEETFKKFKQGAANDYRVKFSARDDMNHIEAKILEFAAKLHPEVFVPLDEFCSKNADFMDRAIAVFDREVQFNIAYLEYAAALRGARLQFCYPRISETSRVHGYDGFDIALAHKLLKEKSSRSLSDVDLIRYRQHVYQDCFKKPAYRKGDISNRARRDRSREEKLFEFFRPLSVRNSSAGGRSAG